MATGHPVAMWTFRQSTGELSHDGKAIGRGYSGHAEHANQPRDQALAMLGPIPRGRYTFENWRDDPTKGKIVCNLVPDPANEMYGRSGFMLHGDNAALNRTASEGCMIQEQAVRLLVLYSCANGDNHLEVIE